MTFVRFPCDYERREELARTVQIGDLLSGETYVDGLPLSGRVTKRISKYVVEITSPYGESKEYNLIDCHRLHPEVTEAIEFLETEIQLGSYTTTIVELKKELRTQLDEEDFDKFLVDLVWYQHGWNRKEGVKEALKLPKIREKK